MKTSAIFAAAVAATTLGTALPAFADRIDDRQARQIQRIEQGYRSGSLTRSEYNDLIAQQREIASLERRLERDGRLTTYERYQLASMQNAASRNIFWQKHDREYRHDDRGYGYGWGRGNGDRYGDGYGRGGPRRWWQWY
ncbi:MAG: hypothetical protein ACT4N2_00640 [Hyphomicrobium sp.]